MSQRYRFPAALAALAACGLLSAAASTSPPPDSHRFVGTWDLVTLRAEWPDGRVSEPWGASPLGRLVYDSEGRMTAVLMHQDRNEATGQPSSQDLQGQMASYYGNYEVDASRSVVIHHVAASFRTNESGVLERRYAFDNGLLVLAAPGQQAGVAVTYVLVWRRAPIVE